MRGPATLAVLLLTGACRSSAPTTPAEIEAALQAGARTVVRQETFTLFSPYDGATTADFATVVREQDLLVRSLFDDQGEPAVRLYLVPVEADAESLEHEPWTEASRGGFGGGAFEAGFAFVYVRGTATSSAHIHAAVGARTVRHELAHLYARRAGLVRARWFHEGLAREIENMRAEGSDLHPHVFPQALIAARKSAQAGSVKELLDWKRADEIPIAEHARRYDLSQALFRFLVERQAEGEWLQRARGVLALEDEQIVALEPAWQSWLGDLDALAAIREGTRSTSAAEREESASQLPVLAERGAAEVLTRAGDELGLELLSDPGTSTPAASFLLYFRAKKLTEEDVASLSRSDDPTFCLTGLALRARRGETFDLERAQAVWERVSARNRQGLEAQRNLLGLGERKPVSK